MYHQHRCAPTRIVLIQLSQTETNAQGQSTTTVLRAIRANKLDRVAKLEWAPGGGLGRAVLGKVRPLPQINHLTSFLRSPLITEPDSYGRLGPTGSQNACACFLLCLEPFPSDVGKLEIESIQRPRWLPVQMETKCY
jgi:hypothetical protein